MKKFKSRRKEYKRYVEQDKLARLKLNELANKTALVKHAFQQELQMN